MQHPGATPLFFQNHPHAVLLTLTRDGGCLPHKFQLDNSEAWANLRHYVLMWRLKSKLSVREVES